VKRFAALLPLAASTAFAQCVMCFRTAAAQQAERARVMNIGIIIMLIPPVAILGGFMLLCYKRNKTYAATEPPRLAPAEPELEMTFSGDQR
jgi:hypothetical protein